MRKSLVIAATVVVLWAIIASAGHPGMACIIVAMIAGYFLPTIIALQRRMPDTGNVFMVNALFGWTIGAWFLALIMALQRKTEDGRGRLTLFHREDG